MPDKIPSSGIGAACPFHEEQCQHFAFSILFCPIQIALHIILSELRILLETNDQLSFKEVVKVSLFGQSYCPFPFENPANSPYLELFYLSTTVS